MANQMTMLRSARARDICARIKKIEIQGAHRVARHGLRAFFYEMLFFCRKKRGISEIRSRAEKISGKIKSLRSTEPMLSNYLDDILFDLSSINTSNTEEDASDTIKRYVHSKENFLEDKLRDDRKLLAKHGEHLIRNGDAILTHCHSTSVILSLAGAKKSGKKFRVFTTETRPLYQGRKTAKDLLAHGIDVTLIVDSSAASVMDRFRITKVFVGGDSVSRQGSLANKIGTQAIAELARARKIPVYACVELYKLDPRKEIVVEQRDPHEVLPQIPKKLKVLNPAFDVTPSVFVKGYVTEKGVLRPAEYAATAKKTIKMFNKKMVI